MKVPGRRVAPIFLKMEDVWNIQKQKRFMTETMHTKPETCR